MGNCKSASIKHRSASTGKKVTLAILGLDNAGKTVTAKRLQGAIATDVAPTVGYCSVKFAFDGHDVTLYDLGGGSKIRGIWHNYYAEVYGFVFVVDASDESRLDECRHVIATFLDNELAQGKPLLLLANKQDVAGALDEGDICDRLDLETLANRYETPCRVELCSALTYSAQKKNPDESIQSGVRWLLRMICAMWSQLDDRVRTDVERKAQNDRREKAERAKRVQCNRQLREQEERSRGELRRDDDYDDDAVDANPFRPIDQQLRAAQGKDSGGKKKKTSTKNRRYSPGDDGGQRDVSPRRSDVETRTSPSKFRRQGSVDRLDSLRKERQRVDDQYGVLGPLPPVSTPSSGRDADQDGDRPRESYRRLADDEDSGYRPAAGRQRQQLQPVTANGSVLPRSAGGSTAPKLAPIIPVSQLEPISSNGGVHKKKKFKWRNNQTAPYDEPATASDALHHDEQTESPPPCDEDDTRGRQQQLPQLRFTRSPRLDRLREEDSRGDDVEENESRFGHKWNMVDDLPAMPVDDQFTSHPKSLHRRQPNGESSVVPVSLRTLDFNV